MCVCVCGYSNIDLLAYQVTVGVWQCSPTV